MSARTSAKRLREAIRRGPNSSDEWPPTRELVAHLDRVRRETAVAHDDPDLWVAILEGLDAIDAPEAARSAVECFLGRRGLARAGRTASARGPLESAYMLLANGDLRAASIAFAKGGLPAHAGVFAQRSGDDALARSNWTLVANQRDVVEDLYVGGLVAFNLSNAAAKLGDAKDARHQLARSFRLLEEAADTFERSGERERAFDCYQVLIHAGRSSAFENLAEGYTNCIRILTEDRLHRVALRYTQDFQLEAASRKEFRAAAQVTREAAVFCRTRGLPYAMYFAEKAADYALADAQEARRRGATGRPLEMSFGAAVEGFASLEMWSRAAQVLTRMSELDLPAERRANYQTLATAAHQRRSRGSTEKAPPPGTKSGTYPSVWELDVLEWEQRGDVAATFAPVAVDDRIPSTIRARATIARVIAILSNPNSGALFSREEVVSATADVGIYEALSPIEAAYAAAEGSPSDRAACVAGLKSLFFKRSYRTLTRALSDPSPLVQDAARDAVEALHMKHAIDPLLRILRGAKDAVTRHSVLRSLGKIAEEDACEALLDTVRDGDASDRVLAISLLRENETETLPELIRARIVDVQDRQARSQLELIASRARTRS